jgi:hypothetical protein
MSKNATNAPLIEPARQQLVLDPRSPTGWRIVDLPAPPSQPVAFLTIAQPRFDVKERRQINTEQDWLHNARQNWPPQKGPPDPAPPTIICRLDEDEVALANENRDQVFLDDASQIRILAGRDPWRLRHPKPFVFGLQSQLTAYELAKALDGRHPYSELGDHAEDEERGDTRRDAISLSDRCQKFFDTIVRAYRAKRLKTVPTSWSEEADETRLVFKVADVLAVILAELADELAALGDGSVIGLLRTQRDTAMAEREAQAVAPKRRRFGPTPTAAKIRKAGKALMKEGHVPGETVQWERFRDLLCKRLGVKPETRGYGLDTTQEAMRPILNKRRAQIVQSTESTES